MTTFDKKIVVAIDGPAAAGKGTLAKRIAKYFGLSFLDTGKLYRAVGFNVLNAGGDPSDSEFAAKIANGLKPSDLFALLKRPELVNENVGQAASKVSAIPAVRKALLDLQQNFAINPPQTEDNPEPKGAVLDGRDIGTVICPKADFKLFVTASVEIRAKRRLLELQERGEKVIEEQVLKDMKERDERDSKRSVAPLVPADDALVLDTSDFNADEVFAKAVAFIEQKK
ncbi:MAG: (d)CMP kinase [Alphaproteobacteria bacterium]